MDRCVIRASSSDSLSFDCLLCRRDKEQSAAAYILTQVRECVVKIKFCGHRFTSIGEGLDTLIRNWLFSILESQSLNSF